MVGPTYDEERALLSALDQAYGSVYQPLPPDWNSYERFYDLLNDLDLTSSPGYPYLREAPTIGRWLKADGMGGFDKFQVERLWYDVRLVMTGNYQHRFRAFVKDEPHKKAKALEGRWRLIIASSLPVQMAWRLCFTHQNASLNANPYRIPSKHGLVFCYGGWRKFLADVRTRGMNIARDVRAWDVNAPGWVFKLIGEWRSSWPGIGSDWINLQQTLYSDAFEHAEIVFSNGLVVRQEFAGFMKSGIFNTIADNSLAMYLMHVLACLRSGLRFGNFAATGDDVLQSAISDSYLDQLQRSGCRIKEVLNHVEFMGTNFSSGYPEPMYFQKHLINFCSKPGIEEELLDSYMRLYAYSDKREVWMSLASALGLRLRSFTYYKFWYSSPLAKVMSDLW